MCGIAGTFAYHSDAPPSDAAEVQRMTDAMALRGPDGQGLWTSSGEGRVILGHRRLSIIDLSEAGAQPMLSADGRLAITFNGEIYNYRALRQDLERRGWRFRSASDTEVLLALWDAHGPDMVHHLRGMFAFALWDDRQQSLFLARDPFGIKPLYYADDGKTLRFASQVKALMAGKAIVSGPDLAAWAGFYLLGYVPEPHTIHKAIRALPPGQTRLLRRDGAIIQSTYFHLNEELRSAEASALELGPGEAQGRLREALRDSVRAHLVSDVPVGLFLSAGLDSSTITALAAEQAPERLRAITLGFREFQGSENDEAGLAALAARHIGVDHQVHWITQDDFKAHLARALAAMDQPSIDGINTYFVSLAAAQDGMKVALSGLGGDELLAGYPSFRQVPRLARTLAPFTHLPGLGAHLGIALRRVVAPFLRGRLSPKYAGLLEYGGGVAGAYLLRRALFMPWELPQLLGTEDAAQAWEELNLMGRLSASIQGLRTDRGRLMALEMGWYMSGQLLKDTDWSAMGHSLEVRVPMVDRDLFRALAPLQVGKSPLGKSDLAYCPAASLPEPILHRPKTGFAVPVRTWAEAIYHVSGRGLRGWASVVLGPLPGYESHQEEALNPTRPEKRVLIFRIGSLGDTVVALPCFHLIARRYPEAQRIVLSDMSKQAKAPQVSAILGESGLVHGFLEYPTQVPWYKKWIILHSQIKAFRPEVLIYLSPPRSAWQTCRDWALFSLMGVPRIKGIPWRASDRYCKKSPKGEALEYEAERLKRCMSFMGNIDLEDPTSWDLRLRPLELARAEALLSVLPTATPILAFSIGTKLSVNDWGAENWSGLLQSLKPALSDWSLLIIGSADERGLSDQVAAGWLGPKLNLCGDLTPRESAAALQKATLFLGHDSGPMHLAAAAGLPCVAVFSARNRPREWYPYGDGHTVLYNDLPCAGCHLETCVAHNKLCITSIAVQEVLEAVLRTSDRLPSAKGVQP